MAVHSWLDLIALSRSLLHHAPAPIVVVHRHPPSDAAARATRRHARCGSDSGTLLPVLGAGGLELGSHIIFCPHR
jgi:hypothetical protein